MSHEPYEKFEHAGCIVELYQDELCEGPREWDNEDIVLRAYHRDFHVDGIHRMRDGTHRYDTLGMTQREAVEFYKECMRKNARKQACEWELFPLYAYIHSGVVLSVGEPDYRWPDQQWDVSHLGWVAVRKSAFRGHACRLEVARAHVEEWNQYLSGDVWYVRVTLKPITPDGYETEAEDDCGGYYGLDYAREEGRAMAEQLRAWAKPRIVVRAGFAAHAA